MVSVRREKAQVRWADIKLIAAFKFDAFTVDTICLRFDLDNAESVVVNEDQAGYAELVHALAEKFPAFDKDFYEKIVKPPFAENYTVVYIR